ncbi:MAG: YkgJ family cysteine cluster protein [Methanoregulaceae archaeon]
MESRLPKDICLTFQCQRCGTCCRSLGEIIEILEEIQPFQYRITFSPTGEQRMVSVDSDKQELFRLPEPKRAGTNPCPFFRNVLYGNATCTIHTSRPAFCQDYFCMHY